MITPAATHLQLYDKVPHSTTSMTQGNGMLEVFDLDAEYIWIKV